ncbi:MAG TPA: DUF5666 domain-containing protein [Methylophilaceae bacterium]|nr:DUF5666 domain-containing protein [Methylophilaceae bacterium]
MRKTTMLKCLVAACYLLGSSLVLADEEFYGVIEQRPQTNLGMWVIAGQQIEVTKKTELESDHGPLAVGACVEVEHKKNVAEEIESVKPEKCSK